MGKSTKTYEERISEKDSKIERLMQALKQQEAQRKLLLKRQKEDMHYVNLSLQHQNYRQKRWKISSCFCDIPVRWKVV
mgnify:CR=1 FL=1